MEIIPAILTSNPDELREKIQKLTLLPRGLFRRIQIDVVDEKFTNNKTASVEALLGIDTDLLFDIQLMVYEPGNWVAKCSEAMAERVIGHVEQMVDQNEFIATVSKEGLGVGLGLDIHTPVEAIEDVLSDLDVVLLMSVESGFGGQKFDESVISKIEKLSEWRRKKDHRFNICVDGGVNEENIVLIAEAGADEVAVGNSLWKEGKVEEAVEKLRMLAGESE